MDSKIHESDKLKLPECVLEPDPRTRSLVKVNKKTGEVISRTINEQYQAVVCFTLNSTVPSRVATHFETAKNLYLYAWFVYRFYSVAEQHVLASLEFALRERFSEFVAEEKDKHPRSLEPGLKKLLKYAISGGFVANNKFPARERWARLRAKSRYQRQKNEEMRKAGINSWTEDGSEIVVLNEDLDFDWLNVIYEIIPNVRNSYAHGSENLNPSAVLRTFEIVSGIIDQLYPME